MGAMLAGWIGLASVSLRRTRVAVTNNGRLQRIGGGDAGRPACADRCENLHRQGNQDDWKKFSQPPPHREPQLPQHCQLIMHRAGCRDRRPRRWASGTIMGLKSNALAWYARTSPDPDGTVGRARYFQSSAAPLVTLPGLRVQHSYATRGGEIPIISLTARILNNRC